MSFRLGSLALPLFALAACTATSGPPTGVTPPAQVLPDLTQAQFSEELTKRTFDYFWDTTDRTHCLAPDRWPSNPFSSIASTGFALTAFGIGAERGYVARDEAAKRTRDCLDFYWNAPQGAAVGGVTGYKGFFYHFLNNEDGTRHGKTELSTVDTSLFLGGVLFAQSYYDRDTPVEAEIRDLAEKIYARVDWSFVQRENSDIPSENGGGPKAIAMGWYPERGNGGDFGTHDWVGYNEGMLVYILALGSPTHALSKEAWDKGWAAHLDKDWGSFYGQQFLQFEPLFGHQYSHVWVDFRGIRDDFMRRKGIDYFENSRRATLSQRAYGADNPNRWTDYSADIWGWTASDGPGYSKDEYSVNGRLRSFNGYMARGVSSVRIVDDGTVVPTAPGGSVAFAPEVAIPALMAMRAKYGARLYTRYGFKDAINPSFTFPQAQSRSGAVDPRQGWVANDYLGIDQGPILAMMENHRSGLIWQIMRKNPHIVRGLRRIGFEGGWLDEAQAGGEAR